jgi:hypothetical protein
VLGDEQGETTVQISPEGDKYVLLEKRKRALSIVIRVRILKSSSDAVLSPSSTQG